MLQQWLSYLQMWDQAAMLPWRMAVLALFICCMRSGVSRHRTKALFPAARAINRDLSMVNPVFQSSFDDVNLLFEILLTGINFKASGEFSVEDAELASLRKTKKLEVICEDIIPRKLSDIFRLIAALSNHIGHLHQDDFERTLLTLVYTVHGMANSTFQHQREVWADSFVALYRSIKQDLAGTN